MHLLAVHSYFISSLIMSLVITVMAAMMVPMTSAEQPMYKKSSDHINKAEINNVTLPCKFVLIQTMFVLYFKCFILIYLWITEGNRPSCSGLFFFFFLINRFLIWTEFNFSFHSKEYLKPCFARRLLLLYNNPVVVE